MSERYLMHVVIDTGDRRRSYRSEAADNTVTHLRKQIEAMLAEEHVEIRPGYRLTGNAHGSALLATVCVGEQPLVTIGVAARSQSSARLWEELINVKTVRDDVARPEAPWCAVRLHSHLLLDPMAASWLGDFERCLAWAWIEHKGGS